MVSQWMLRSESQIVSSFDYLADAMVARGDSSLGHSLGRLSCGRGERKPIEWTRLVNRCTSAVTVKKQCGDARRLTPVGW